jgi:hypothetical protein
MRAPVQAHPTAFMVEVTRDMNPSFNSPFGSSGMNESPLLG